MYLLFSLPSFGGAGGGFFPSIWSFRGRLLPLSFGEGPGEGLIIPYRISIRLSDAAAHARALPLNDIAQHLRCEVLALIVADDTYLYLLLMAEVLMVVHLTCHERIGTSRNDVIEQEVPCPAADSHLSYRPMQQLVAHRTLSLHSLLHILHKRP